jgi:hypothetical protein
MLTSPHAQVGTFGLLAAAAMAGVRQWRSDDMRALKSQTGTFLTADSDPLARVPDTSAHVRPPRHPVVGPRVHSAPGWFVSPPM